MMHWHSDALLNYFPINKNTGPTTVKAEYFSIILTRSFVRLIFGYSSACCIEARFTLNCRAASAFDIPALIRQRFANAASCRSETVSTVRFFDCIQGFQQMYGEKPNFSIALFDRSLI
jgi:hypothetical protein